MNFNIAQLEYKLNQNFQKEYGTFIGYFDNSRGWRLIVYFGTQLLTKENSADVLELYDGYGVVKSSFDFLKDYVRKRKVYSEDLFNSLTTDCFKLSFFKREEVRDIRFYKYRHRFDELNIIQLENLEANLRKLDWFNNGDEIAFEQNGIEYGKATLIDKKQMLCVSRTHKQPVNHYKEKQFAHLFEELIFCALNMLSLFKITCRLDELADIGCLIEWFNKKKHCTELAIYLGDRKLLYIYDSLAGINQAAFSALANKQLGEYEEIFGELDNNLLYEKRYINVLNGQNDSTERVERLKSNLTKLHASEESDIMISYEKGHFHASILLDKGRMVCIHVDSLDDVVREESLLDFMKYEGGLLKVENGNEVFDIAFMNISGQKKLDVLPKKDILKRAKLRIGIRNYYYLNGNNCQDFVTECRFCYSFNQE